MSSKNDYEYGARSCRMDQVRRLSLFSYKSIFLLEVPWSKLPQNQRLRLLSERICPPRRGSRESNSGNLSKIECKVVHAGSSSTSFGQHINAVVNCDNNSKYPWSESDRTKYNVIGQNTPFRTTVGLITGSVFTIRRHWHMKLLIGQRHCPLQNRNQTLRRLCWRRNSVNNWHRVRMSLVIFSTVRAC